jgi:hypothetical protein
MLLHQCYSRILDGWNAFTANVKSLEWADGVWRRSLIVLGGLLSDQPEADAFCCDGSQTCKACKCPKSALCDHSRVFPLKKAEMVQNMVMLAAKGMYPPGENGERLPKLFDRDRRNPMVWKPTRECTKARYERVRKALGGTHIMPNAFWAKTLFDVQRLVRICTYLYESVRICTYLVRILYVCVRNRSYVYVLQTFKDAMHAFDHGVAMNILTAIIMCLHALEDILHLPRNTLVRRLTARMHLLCRDTEVKHATLMSFVHQSIMDCLETYITPGKKGQKQSPIVDASDVQRLMLTMPFMLASLASEELQAYNHGKSAAERVADPIPDVIMAVNDWLHWYHLYRQPESDDESVDRLTDMGKNLLATLQRVFPYTVRVSAQHTRSMWCTEKVHSILHAPDNIRKVGRSQNITCQVTEARHVLLKAKGHLTNRDPATYGKSIMLAEVRESAAQQMAQHVDARGMQLVCFLNDICVRIRAYTYAYVHIRTKYVRIRTYTYVFVHIRTYSYQSHAHISH